MNKDSLWSWKYWNTKNQVSYSEAHEGLRVTEWSHKSPESKTFETWETFPELFREFTPLIIP